MTRRPDRSGGAPTLATVAAEAGVSRQTVSNALNSPDLLRPETLERVQEAIGRLGYSPNRAARNLRTRSSHLIGLRVEPAVEDSANAMMDRFLHSLVESTRDAGYHVLLFTGGETGADAGLDAGTAEQRAEQVDPMAGYDELLRSAAVDAFLVTDTYRGNPQAAWLEERGVPFVAFGRPWGEPGPGTPGSTSTGAPGSCWPSTTSSSAATSGSPGSGGRRAPTSARTAAAGGPTGCTTTDCPPAGSARAATTPSTSDGGPPHALLDTENPSAFVCASDTLAMGVLRAFARAGPAARTRAVASSGSTTRWPPRSARLG